MISATLSDRRWALLIVLIVVGLGQSLGFIGLVYSAKDFVANGLYEVSFLSGAFVFASIVCLALGRFLERFFSEKFAQNYVRQLREQIFEFSLTLPAFNRDLLNGGATLLRLTSDMSAIRNWLVQGVAPLTVLSIWLVISLVNLLNVHWSLGILLIFCLMLTVLGNYVIGSYLYQASERVRKTRGGMIRSTSEKLRLFFLIKTFNQAGKEKRQFNKRSKRLLKYQTKKAKISALLRSFNEAALLGTLAVLFVRALQLEEKGIVSLDTVAVLLTAGLYLLSQMRRLSRLYELWTLKNVATDKISEFFALAPETTEGRKALQSDTIEVKLRKVSVKDRFAPFSAVLEQSSRILLIGRQGAGKSSLLMAIAGLLPIDNGRISINGRDATNFHPVLWSKTFSLISPEIPLMRGSLRDNLFYGARKQQTEYVETVLKLTKIDENELDRVQIKEAGQNLSDGLKFRFKLARALLRKPKVLLIDNEPALNNLEIIKIIEELSEMFDGPIILASYRPELSYLGTATWNLDEKKIINTGLSRMSRNVVMLKTSQMKE